MNLLLDILKLIVIMLPLLYFAKRAAAAAEDAVRKLQKLGLVAPDPPEKPKKPWRWPWRRTRLPKAQVHVRVHRNRYGRPATSP